VSTTTSPGRKFFDVHLDYIYANKIDQMIDDQYTEDAVLISPFEVPGYGPGPHIVKGNQALKRFFHAYIAWQGELRDVSVNNFAETDDSIFFQALFTSNSGRWAVGDAWHMRGGLTGKIDVHYSFAYKAG
jgi:hypothetical protein